jgi:hypothetical protein
MARGMLVREMAGATALAIITLGAAANPALAGTDDLGSVAGIDYRARSNTSPIAAPGVSLGPDAECVEGDKLVGGGVAIGGDFSESLINRSSPGDQSLSSPQAWVAIWANVAGGPKSATVTVACMDRDVKRTKRTKQVEGGTSKALKASCPAGTHVASGGGFILGSEVSDYLNSSYPIDDGDSGHEPDDGWKVRVWNGEKGPADATVEAQCVEFHPSYRTADPISIDDGATVDKRARCPGDAHVIGGGLHLGGAASQAHPVTITLEDGGDGDAIPDDRYLSRAGNVGGTDHKRMTVFAVCRG